MVDERIRTTTTINVISSIFQDGDQAVHFGTKMVLQCLKQITLAIPKLKLIVNRTIIDGYVIGEKGSTTGYNKCQPYISHFQDGGQTVHNETKGYKRSTEDLQVRCTKT